MSFRQLYYTSCEQGLSGYAGYQFNAVTPGTSAETKRQVESLTGYEAPHSMAYAVDAGDLARCPVNLCYVPGSPTIVANVQYVGKDSSQRFGNYFAHALATADGSDFSGLLPIELWRAPLWVAEQARSPELPGVEGPLAPGPLNRAEVARFIAGHPHRDHLPALLSAVGLAREGTDRPVLVVEESADDVAKWFAAVSYLLPEPFVRQISFATYLSRPSHSRLHLRGTIAETNLDLGSDAMENFSLFDFRGARFSPVAEHPLARLTARVEMPIASALWNWAGVLARGEESSFDDWYPVTAAAAALGHIELGGEDAAAAASWLESATYLDPARQSEIAWALHDSPALAVSDLVTVREVGQRTGDQALDEQVQCELLEADMRAAMATGTGSGAASQAPIAEATVRSRIGARCQEALQQCDSGPSALRLLDWAGLVRPELAAEVIIWSTRNVIAPWLATDVPGHPLAGEFRLQAHRVARRWQEARTGLVIYLAGLSNSAPATLPAVMSGLVGELLVEEDLRGHPELVELYLVYLARRQSGRAVNVLAQIAERRAGQTIDEQLLRLIWPSGRWTRKEALEVLRRLSADQLRGSGVPDWFGRAAENDLRTADIGTHVTLCHRLLAAPLAERLPAWQIESLRAAVEVDRAVAHAVTLKDLAPVIGAHARSDFVPVRAMMRGRVAVALPRLDVRAEDLAWALQRLDDDAFAAYSRKIHGMLTQQDTRLRAHVAGLWLLVYRGLEPPRAGLALEDLGYAAEHWQRKTLDDVARRIEAADPRAAASFRSEVGEIRTGTAKRALRSAAGKVAGLARGKPPDPGARSAGGTPQGAEGGSGSAEPADGSRDPAG
jgi:GTPase-associated protein 1, N-terminal domain type 2/GTPase-associated protein 1, C-terminal domain/GTPase-associated protein 1, middle domain